MPWLTLPWGGHERITIVIVSCRGRTTDRRSRNRGSLIGLSIAGNIAVAISKPSEADKSDERDKDIKRFGEYVGGIVLAIGMLVPFGLALAESESFWIANAMYLAFVLSALTSSVVKVVAYRRGL